MYLHEWTAAVYISTVLVRVNRSPRWSSTQDQTGLYLSQKKCNEFGQMEVSKTNDAQTCLSIPDVIRANKNVDCHSLWYIGSRLCCVRVAHGSIRGMPTH